MLLDTSGLLCLHNRAEPLHTQARTLYQATHVRVTHSYVLAEFVALAHARRLPRVAALTFMRDLVENPDIDTVWVDEALHRAAMALLMARLDKTYSLCDEVLCAPPQMNRVLLLHDQASVAQLRSTTRTGPWGCP